MRHAIEGLSDQVDHLLERDEPSVADVVGLAGRAALGHDPERARDVFDVDAVAEVRPVAGHHDAVKAVHAVNPPVQALGVVVGP